MSATKKSPASESRFRAAAATKPDAVDVVSIPLEAAKQILSCIDNHNHIVALLLAIESLTDEANAVTGIWLEATGRKPSDDGRYEATEEHRNDGLRALHHLSAELKYSRDKLREFVHRAQLDRAPRTEVAP